MTPGQGALTEDPKTLSFLLGWVATPGLLESVSVLLPFWIQNQELTFIFFFLNPTLSD